MIEKLCRNCFNSFRQYQTTQTLCPKCAYNKYAKPKKAIKRVGKKAAAWIEERHEWIKNNPGEYDGKWKCYLQTTEMCPKLLDIDQLTLDHVIPRSSLRGTENKTELKPCCIYCNQDKGSQSLENYLKNKRMKLI